MRFTLLSEIGWCGFGCSGGLVPELRLGLIRLACCRGSIIHRLREVVMWGQQAREVLLTTRRPRIVPAPPPASEREP